MSPGLCINVHADFKVNAQARMYLTYIIEALSYIEYTEKKIDWKTGTFELGHTPCEPPGFFSGAGEGGGAHIARIFCERGAREFSYKFIFKLFKYIF
jgi:hypothetical protein